MKVLQVILLSIFALMMVACASSPKIYTDFDTTQDFSQYRTFTWVSDKPLSIQSESIISPLVEQRIIDAVKAGMESKGYRFVESIEDSDISLGFTVGSREKVRITQDPNLFFANNWFWGGHVWGLNPAFGQERARRYDRGSLAIDVFDNKRELPVWHGVSSKRIRSEEMAGEAEFVNETVAATLSSFPDQGQALQHSKD